MRKLILAMLACGFFYHTSHAQTPTDNPTCDYNAILVVIRAYEDSLAIAKSLPVVREDYTLPGNNSATNGEYQYRLYRCPALLDSLTVLMNEVEIARAAPPSPFVCGISAVRFDNHSYRTIQMGSQCWFAENLRNDNYYDGTVIPGNLSNAAWSSTTAGAQAVYGQGGASEATSLSKYGRLYNWFAVSDAAGICPTGWHVPTDEEWDILVAEFGGASVAGAALKSPSPAWNGTNSSGFSGLPTGRRLQDGNFDAQVSTGLWWSSTADGANAWNRTMGTSSSNVSRFSAQTKRGFAVRCLRDPATAPSVDTDEAGSVTETEATLNATFADGGSEVTVTGFKYGTDAALSSPTDVAGSATSSPFTAALTGLTHATQYWAVGYATNAVGTSYGDTITFTTLAYAPTVDTDAAGTVTETEATLNATFTDGGSGVTATGFKYGTDAALSSPTDVAGSGTTSPFTAALTGLTASTQYWAVGYATNAVGTSYGDTITFTTPTPTSCSVPSVTYDGYTYTTVSIGTQCWFKENLRNEIYSDGTPIPGWIDAATWLGRTSGAQAIAGEGGPNESSNLATYGRLYNEYAVHNEAGLCPTGWHVPTQLEFGALNAPYGVAVAQLKSSPTDTPAWNGTNTTGFSALPGGAIQQHNGLSGFVGSIAFFWSSTKSGSGTATLLRVINNDYASTAMSGAAGFSVRCIQDPPTAPTVDTDAAGSVTETEATLNATFTDGGSAVTATGFKYGTDAALSSPTDVAGSGTTSPFTAALTGLTASTQYWAVGYATNAVGTSYGDTITFTTSAPTSCSVPSVTYDGYTYTTVSIGTQCWFKENLRNENYSDGTPIPGWIDAATWSGRTIGAQGIAGEGGSNAASNLATYGRLYNAYAVLNDAGLCPTGWHVPTFSEFDVLHTAIGGDAASLKSSPSDTPAWNGSNTSGFSALPSGYINTSGATDVVGAATVFWSSTFNNSTNTRTRVLTTSFSSSTYSNVFGFSVRCIQDPPTAPTVDTDAASSVTSSAATLNATFTDGGSAVTATGFKYGTDALLTSPTDVAGSGTTSPFTAALTGLTASTQYWAVGYATNAVGTSYGDTITFTTSAAAAFTCGTSTVTYDGHNYTTVQIGTQCWFKENLRNDNYNDGTVIDGGLDNSAWTARTTGAFTIYDEGGANEASNLATYGRLYNWYAVTNAAGLCPTGWHVPTDAEWTTLETELGGVSVAGSKMKATTPAWDGNNSSGFSGLPAGYRNLNGNFYLLGDDGYWWSSSPNGLNAISRDLYSGDSGVLGNYYNTRSGFSVRCVQDPASAPTVDTDAAGTVTETEATLTATYTDGGSAVTATGFKYGTDAALSSPTDVAGSGTTSPFTAALTGLTHSTQYWAVGYATNAVGTSYGDTITFTTSPFFCANSTVPYDGHNYTTVQIGSQCWFKENLRNDNYNDGTPIPGNLDGTAWESTSSGAQAVYGEGSSTVYDGSDDEAANLAIYGRLYNWYAVNTGNLCPSGWHVPEDYEWTSFVTELGYAAGDQLKASIPDWDGNNSSEFSALPGGIRGSLNGSFQSQGLNAHFWSSSPTETAGWIRILSSGDSDVLRGNTIPRNGFSVRCVQDND